MKKAVPLLIVFAILIYVLPFTALLVPSAAVQGGNVADFTASSAVQSTSETQPFEGSEFLILDEGNGEVLRVTEREFTIGAICAEMPLTWSDEALKAQAVAAHSYALNLVQNTNPEDASLKGAYFKANPSKREGFLTKDVQHLVWGDAYADNRKKAEAIVDSVFNEILTYENAPALACYHAISNGSTISSEAVWGRPVPYLVSVDSSLDATSEDFEKIVTLNESSVKETLIMSFAGLKLPDDPSKWFGETKISPEGYITEINVGGAFVNANDLRNALKLRSTAFTIKYENKAFVFTTHGYGHGVGMSQYGANIMAQTGKTYQEILAHYYPNAVLTNIKES